MFGWSVLPESSDADIGLCASIVERHSAPIFAVGEWVDRTQNHILIPNFSLRVVKMTDSVQLCIVLCGYSAEQCLFVFDYFLKLD